MKKLLALLLFAVASLAHGQTIYTPGGVNYGGGLVIKETRGTGAPSPTCSGFVRYWQTDASTSPFWQCVGTTMVNVGATSSSGGTSFAVTTTATGLQSMTGPLASTFFQVGNADTTIWRCGTKCLSLGSTSGATDGTIKALNYIGNANGILNAAISSGADIGAQVNSAYASCSDSAPCHVVVPPGVYSYATPILMPQRTNGSQLTIDRNAKLTFTGTGDAIGTPAAVNGLFNRGGTMIDGGGQIIGTSAANAGVHFRPGQGYTIKDLIITGFTSGDGIWVDGTNVVDVDDVTSAGNLNGIHLTGNQCNGANACAWGINSSHVWVNAGVSATSGYAPNAVSVHRSRLTGNFHWGALEMDINPSTSSALGNTFEDNDFEGNGKSGANWGAVASCFSSGATYSHNYFEGSPREVLLGCSGDPGVIVPSGYNAQFGGTALKARIVDNYFTSGAAIEVAAHFAGDPVISHNVETASGSTCFVDGTFASGDIEIVGNRVTATHETCQGGVTAPGGYLVNFVEHYSSSGKVFGGTVVVGGNALVNGAMNSATVLTTGGAEFNQNRTCDDVAATNILVGSVKIFSSCHVLTGSCGGASAIGISPFGVQSCKSGTWGPAN